MKEYVVKEKRNKKGKLIGHYTTIEEGD